MTIGHAIVGGFSITIGYHRLWSHRSFQACIGIRILLAAFGAGEVQWPILWWVKHHRAHHTYTDTDQDPSNAKRGLLFSHIGWLLGLNEAAWGPADVSDLEDDPVVIWQQRLYYPILVVVGFLLPTTVAYYGWNDWKGGLLYGGLTRVVVTQQITFLNNSVAHASWAGSQPYSTKTTARNVRFLSFLNLGEGNHNFHHTFPVDYRSGVEWREPNVSRWVIWLWGKLGLAFDLKTVSPREIERARLIQKRGGIYQRLYYNEHNTQSLSQLPRITWDEYRSRSKCGNLLVSIGGAVYDVAGFMDEHPGGRDLIQKFIGKDATESYYGHHLHSPDAEGILERLCVSRLADDLH
ncbi:uncharacterized protein N7496_000941 [Penicillium cataractarum]|uniref:Cytochrome b5 heme-binding domain-containing protein n=1 Tax=Penicillium cataractarum TaxID=2100454 RepID=A0A9W9VV51_9EURO|nr:uncharacterized protein N7496_000941 [Penicillium cataractarum]KAJ5389873.1 hypothetical protein N7496_000941 [Penicillium cataractarum]